MGTSSLRYNIFQGRRRYVYNWSCVCIACHLIFLFFLPFKPTEASVIAVPSTADGAVNNGMNLFNRSHSAYSLTNGNHLIGLYEFNTGDARDTSPAGVVKEAVSNHTPGSIFSPIVQRSEVESSF